MSTITSLFEYSSAVAKTHVYSSTQAAFAITLLEFALGVTRGPFVRRKIRALTTLTPSGLIAIQRIWSLASLNIIAALFLEKRNASLFFCATNDPLLVLIPIIRTVVEYAPFNVQGKIDALTVPEAFSNLSKKIAYLFDHLRSRLSFREDHLHAIHPTKIVLIGFHNDVIFPSIIEELLFRGVIQEIFLRQLPKLTLRLLSMNTELVDLPPFKIMRIAMSAVFFGIAYSWKNRPSAIFKTILLGLDTAYRYESTGLSAAILSHFNNNLYVTIGSSTHA